MSKQRASKRLLEHKEAILKEYQETRGKAIKDMAKRYDVSISTLYKLLLNWGQPPFKQPKAKKAPEELA